MGLNFVHSQKFSPKEILSNSLHRVNPPQSHLPCPLASQYVSLRFCNQAWIKTVGRRGTEVARGQMLDLVQSQLPLYCISPLFSKVDTCMLRLHIPCLIHAWDGIIFEQIVLLMLQLFRLLNLGCNSLHVYLGVYLNVQYVPLNSRICFSDL